MVQCRQDRIILINKPFHTKLLKYFIVDLFLILLHRLNHRIINVVIQNSSRNDKFFGLFLCLFDSRFQIDHKLHLQSIIKIR